MNVLVVDDEPSTRRLIQHMIRESLAANVTVVPTAYVALAELSSSQFDLVITDVVMPEMNGFDMIRAFRQEHGFLPVIVVSTATDRETMREALRLGVDDFLDKPVTPTMLVSSINAVMHGERQQRRARWAADGAALQRFEDWIFSPIHFRNCAPESNLCCRYWSLGNAGGDCVFATQTNDDKTRLLVGDVAGHDADATFVVAQFTGILSADHGKVLDVPLPTYLRRLNNSLLKLAPNRRRMCAMALCWEQATGAVEIANAGLPYAYYLSANGALQCLELNGRPLGLYGSNDNDSMTIQLRPGDRLLVFSDGLEDHYSIDNICRTWGDARAFNLPDAVAMLTLELNLSKPDVSDDILVVAIEQPASSRPAVVCPQQLHFTVDSMLSEVGPALDRVANFLTTFTRIDAVRLDDVQFCLCEAITNAIRHGNLENPALPVSVQVAVNDTLEFTVSDCGQGFSLEHELKREIHREPGRIGGRGLLASIARSDRMISAGQRVTVTFDHLGAPPEPTSLAEIKRRVRYDSHA